MIAVPADLSVRKSPQFEFNNTHPEYFALVYGQRIPEQYCISTR